MILYVFSSLISFLIFTTSHKNYAGDDDEDEDEEMADPDDDEDEEELDEYVLCIHLPVPNFIYSY
jgi:hypothetical protein